MHLIQETFSHRRPEPEESILYIVGTPIGNLKDISERAKYILSKVSLIACEDTRNTRKLLHCYGLNNKLISFNEHNSKSKIPFLISELKKNKTIALVSDAGMPLISDPGELLIKEVRKAGFEAVTIPGPCAATTALVCSGLSSSRFIFYGFIPKSGKERDNMLYSISSNEFTSIIYESPKRVLKLLEDLRELCGDERKISISKELTKKYEQNICCNFKDAIDYFSKIKPIGEFTLIISPKDKLIDSERIEINLLKDELFELVSAGLSHSYASNYLAKKYKKPKNKIYKLLLDYK
tara:strand:+ start:529 stop:1410 length:882 start_codon:yes stop_codon:yes gene_type:complete